MARQTVCACGCEITFPDDAVDDATAVCPDCGAEVRADASAAFDDLPPDWKSDEAFQEKMPGEAEDAAEKFAEDSQGSSRIKPAMIIGGVAILAAAIILLALLTGRGDALKAEGWAMIPEDAVLIGSVDMDKAMNIPSLRDAARRIETGPELGHLSGMGISTENMRRLYIATLSLTADPAAADTIVIVESKRAMDQISIISALREDGQIGEPEQMGGAMGYELLHGDELNPMALMFARNNLLAYGSRRMVSHTGALAVGNGRNARDNARLADIARGAGDDLFWFAMAIQEGQSDGLLGSPQSALIRGNYRADERVQLDGTVRYAESSEAKEAAELILPVLSLMAVDLGIAAEDIDIRVVDRDLRISAIVSGQLLAMMLGPQF